MKEKEIKNYIKAGEIAKKIKEFSRSIIKDGISYLELNEKVEEKIKELGGKPAFPLNVSINEIAAHDTALPDDKRTLKKGDLVKIDVGVHVDGCIADTAYTIEIGTNNYEKLILASRKALDSAISILKEGTKYYEIGDVIQKEISSFEFTPIINLCGHLLEKNELHTSQRSIPNYNNGCDIKIKTGTAFAIEPFATNGSGSVIDTKPSPIYRLIERKPIRDFKARKILDFIEKEYKYLPFTKRWLFKKFGNVDLALKSLCDKEILHNYNVLKEKDNGMVSQAEETIIITDKVTVTTA